MLRSAGFLLVTYLLLTGLVGGAQILFPAQGPSWLLVLIFGLPLCLMGELTGWLINEKLLAARSVERLGRIPSLILLVVLWAGLFAAAWFTVEHLRSAF